MLTLTNLRKTFGPLVAVEGLSLSIPKGEVFGLLGPNGAGKSTSINMCIGLFAPDSGEVRIESPTGPTNPATPEGRRQLGVAPQSLALYDDLSALENLKFFGGIYGLKNVTSRAEAVLEAVQLTSRSKDRVKTYSGGMKRRLNLAVALLHDPPLLLLDEPTAGVDPQSRNNILELVRSLAAQGKTIIYTTHYMEEAARLCHRIGIIDKGRLLACGTLAELVAGHGGQSVVKVERLDGREDRIETADPVAELSRQLAAGNVQNVHVERPDLETVFLSLTGRSLRD